MGQKIIGFIGINSWDIRGIREAGTPVQAMEMARELLTGRNR